jgi:hypothetical protein
MPAAVGWHPWFVRRLAGTSKSAELELHVEPGLMWANDSTGLPSGKLTAPAPRPWDYCFRELRADPIVRWPGELELAVSSDCEDWIIYDMEDAGVCVEPWTAPPNSLNMPKPHRHARRSARGVDDLDLAIARQHSGETWVRSRSATAGRSRPTAAGLCCSTRAGPWARPPGDGLTPNELTRGRI